MLWNHKRHGKIMLSHCFIMGYETISGWRILHYNEIFEDEMVDLKMKVKHSIWYTRRKLKSWPYMYQDTYMYQDIKVQITEVASYEQKTRLGSRSNKLWTKDTNTAPRRVYPWLYLSCLTTKGLYTLIRCLKYDGSNVVATWQQIRLVKVWIQPAWPLSTWCYMTFWCYTCTIALFVMCHNGRVSLHVGRNAVLVHNIPKSDTVLKSSLFHKQMPA